MRARKYIPGLACIGFLLLFSCNDRLPSKYISTDRGPAITPDYSGIMIPQNIAPLNFIINLKSNKYLVDFSSKEDDGFVLKSKSNAIRIPIKKWKKLLKSHAGKTIQITIYAKHESGNWEKFKTIVNSVNEKKIDPWIAYRRINACMFFYEDMAIVQRSLEDFTEEDIISNENTERNCMNCHTFRNRDPNYFLLHMRKSPNGTLISTKDKKLWLNSKTAYTLSAFVYPAWHPNGNLIAFSTNKIHQNFFGKGNRLNHVRDEASDIVLYDISTDLIFTTPKLATLDFENLPTWSPDGKYLYYINCPVKYKNLNDTLEKYDLMRIFFDEKTHEWGDSELILSSAHTGLSISFPQVSPNGKFLVFCMADYGYFTINNSSSNLYLLDLGSNTYEELPVNSNYAESFPSWSENSRWIMFTTKRIDGRYTVPHFAYIDSSGHAQKPFALPFKDPEAYYTRMVNYNRPVFIKDKVTISEKSIEQIVHTPSTKAYFDSLNVDINALTGATLTKQEASNTSTPYMR
jgi:hypothetical protein